MVQAFGKKHLAILELTLFNLLVFIYLFFFITTAFYKFCGFTMKTYMNSKRKKLLYY